MSTSMPDATILELLTGLASDSAKRREACVLKATKLRVTDAQVMQRLEYLAQNDPVDYVRGASKAAITAIRVSAAQGQVAPPLGPAQPDEVMVPLIAALQAPSWTVRVDAANKMGEYRDARAVEPLIAALHNMDKNTRKAAARALGAIGDPRAIPPLSAALQTEKSDVYAALKEALHKLQAWDVIEESEKNIARSQARQELGQSSNRTMLWGAALLGIGIGCTVLSYIGANIEAERAAARNPIGFGTATYFVFTIPILIGIVLLFWGTLKHIWALFK